MADLVVILGSVTTESIGLHRHLFIGLKEAFLSTFNEIHKYQMN